jgi:hypothetical protein
MKKLDVKHRHHNGEPIQLAVVVVNAVLGWVKLKQADHVAKYGAAHRPKWITTEEVSNAGCAWAAHSTAKPRLVLR